MAKRILITGASGLIGTRLTELLLLQGHEIVHLGRSQRTGPVPSYTWDIAKGTMDNRALNSVDAIINLAGAGIADKRWTPQRKKEIIDSRVQSIAVLHSELKKQNHQVKTFVCASAIGYYGAGDVNELFTESSPPGGDFLALVVKKWEDASEEIDSLDIRLVKIRTGMVLSERGGVLKSMALPVQLGLGAALGSGKQYLSCIHLDDLCAVFMKAVVDKSMHGVYNGVAIPPVTNLELTRAIAKTLKKPLWLPAVPAFVLRIALGELATMVITGSKVSSEKIQKAGLRFMFTDLQTALKNLLRR